MKTKHTQGPWDTEDNDVSRYIKIVSPEGKTIARIPWTSEKESDKHNGLCPDHYDAKLIASAPELLHILNQLATKAFRKDNVPAIVPTWYDGLELLWY